MTQAMFFTLTIVALVAGIAGLSAAWSAAHSGGGLPQRLSAGGVAFATTFGLGLAAAQLVFNA